MSAAGVQVAGGQEGMQLDDQGGEPDRAIACACAQSTFCTLELAEQEEPSNEWSADPFFTREALGETCRGYQRHGRVLLGVHEQ